MYIVSHILKYGINALLFAHAYTFTASAFYIISTDSRFCVTRYSIQHDWGGVWYNIRMMTSSNGNIFRVTGHLCGEFYRSPVNSPQKARDAELCFFFDLRLNKRLSKQWWGRLFETLSRPLWCHCNAREVSEINEGWHCLRNATGHTETVVSEASSCFWLPSVAAKLYVYILNHT